MVPFERLTELKDVSLFVLAYGGRALKTELALSAKNPRQDSSEGMLSKVIK